MKPTTTPAAMSRATPQALVLSGSWTALGMGRLTSELDSLAVPAGEHWAIDASGIEALDTAGPGSCRHCCAGCVMVRLASNCTHCARSSPGCSMPWLRSPLRGPRLSPLTLYPPGKPGSGHGEPAGTRLRPARLHRRVHLRLGWLAGPSDTDSLAPNSLQHPQRRCRCPAHRRFALLLLGIVVAYQGAAQLRLYGANIFVVDLVALSMLREFAPLITAIIVAGRSGSAYAAQIGTMAVTEEIDAMRTIGIAPLDMLVLPKALALLITLPC